MMVERPGSFDRSREWITRRLIDRWLANDLFRQPIYCRRDQNPEYRIAEDARGDGPITMTVGLLIALLSATIFIGTL
jgi:putative ATP-binding cassette transporter